MCDACDAAERQPMWSGFQASCLPCMARMLAHGQPFWQSRRSGRMTPEYHRALQCVFGDDWEKWHETVKDWAERIDIAKVEQREA